MRTLKAKVSKTSGQGITRGAYKTANKLGMKSSTPAGLSALKPKKSKLGKHSHKRLDTVPGEIIDELSKLGMK